MCGIAAFFPAGADEEAIASKALECLRHRGPDADGKYQEDKLLLLHTRLSIIGSGTSANQPIKSLSGRWVITFNGEIYNQFLIRSKLTKPWRGQCDSETVAEAIDEFGFEFAVEQFDGMFAIIAYDRMSKLLYMCTDQFGEKPLFYSRAKGVMVAASSISVLRLTGNLRLDPKACDSFLRYGFIPSPRTIFSEVHKVEPGQILCFELSGDGGRANIRKRNRIRQFRNLVGYDFDGDQFSTSLEQALASRLEADAPVGVFLSGGIDSALIASVGSKRHKIAKTFTTAFADTSVANESSRASQISDYLGIDHEIIKLSNNDLVDGFLRLSSINDEPFSDPAQCPLFLMSERAKLSVKVVLSGDGADELFGGYRRYEHFRRLNFILSKSPSRLRQVASEWASWAAKYCGAQSGHSRFAERLFEIGELFQATSRKSLYRLMLTRFRRLNPVKMPFEDLFDDNRIIDYPIIESKNDIVWASAVDFINYLPNVLLVKNDRATMAAGLECRAPFLSSDLVKYISQLNLSEGLHGTNKKLLRRELENYIPKKFLVTEKQGFSVPVNQIIREKFCCDRLDRIAEKASDGSEIYSTDLLTSGVLSPDQDKRYTWERWRLFMLELWMESNGIDDRS